MATTKKLNILACTISAGLVWAISVLLAGWFSIFGWGNAFVLVMKSIYIGYDPTFVGGIIGGIWAFFDGAIAGLLFSFFYNLIAKRNGTL